ncbi:MAG: hypothetical protein Q8M09_00340 [Pseudomonadota bacterium]|nr:hypothetical protein [Pseudomonadota bacterium]MDP1902693.1 hypothetical protein [Pseudomonadota bacterium]MDP2353371.1 hypothetical protein [Pseudomonadota bacterium]
MNVPTIEMISDFIKAMPVLGDGEVVCESGPNPYDTRSFHPAYDKPGFNRLAYERFEHDRRNWNVLGFVDIKDALGLKKWLKAEAVLWSVGLCLPGSTRHNQSHGGYAFDEESKRRLLDYLEQFLRNAEADELSPAQWIEHAKTNGGYEFTQGSMIENPQFVELWEATESTVQSLSVERIPGTLPPVASGQLAIKAAWQIECETKRRATDKEVMDRLQQWANSGQEDALLKSLPSHAVEWLTKKQEKRVFTLEACQKALAKWHKSRQ